MSIPSGPLRDFVGEVWAAMEQETTLSRFLERAGHGLSGFMTRPDCFEGLGVDAAEFRSWTLYTDPDFHFCVHTSHLKQGNRRSLHDHGALGWAIYGSREGETHQEIYERLDDGSEPGRARLRLLERVVQRPGDTLLIPVGTAHTTWNDWPAGTWNVVIRSSDLRDVWRNRYDLEAGTVTRFRSAH